MTDYKPTLVAALTTLNYPVYYELFLDDACSKPCITYQETNDEAIAEANNNVRYSKKTYQIKLWGGDLADQAAILPLLDAKMFELGFKRINYNELWYNDMLCTIMRYQGLCKD